MHTFARMVVPFGITLAVALPARAERDPRKPEEIADPVERAKSWANNNEVSLYSYQMDAIGKTDGSFAPIVATSNGVYLVGTRTGRPADSEYEIGKSIPVVIKFDSKGKVLWEKPFRRKGYLDFEGGGLARNADGTIVVFILSYVHPSRGAANRLVKLDPKGKVIWDWVGRGGGVPNTPFATKVTLAPNGNVKMTGHLYLKKGDETANGWTGEVDAKGKLIVDETGGPNPYGTPKPRDR